MSSASFCISGKPFYKPHLILLAPFLFYFFSFWIFLFATQDLRALKGKYGKDNIFPQDNQSPFLRRGNNFIFLARTRMQRWQECFNLKTFSEMLWKCEIFLARTRMQRWQECFNLQNFSEMLWKCEIFLVRTKLQGWQNIFTKESVFIWKFQRLCPLEHLTSWRLWVV